MFSIKKIVTFSLLLVVFMIGIGQNTFAETAYNSSSRELDVGYFKIYRFSEGEIEKFTSGQLQLILNTYANMYFSMNMYFTRDLLSIDMAKYYPVNLLDSVYQKIAALDEAERRKRVRRLHINPDGVSIENLQLSTEIEPVLEAWEKQNGRYQADRKKFLITPKNIMLAYAEKMGLSSEKFLNLKDPSMDLLIKQSNSSADFAEYFKVGTVAVLMFLMGYFGFSFLLSKNKKFV